MSNQVFADGFSVFAPRDTAPDFIKGEIVIDVKAFSDFINGNQLYVNNGKLRLDLKESQQGKLYASVNTYQPKAKADTVGDSEDDLPF